MEKEIEAKFFIDDKNLIRNELSKIGLQLIKPEFLMKRKTFDSDTIGKWIRVRDEGDKITMTFKHIVDNTINGVKEIEIIVDNFEKASALINETNFIEASYQENYREIWKNDEVEIVIDTWPYLKNYIEIEAKNEDIVRKYSNLLEFDFDKNALFGSVDILYEKEHNIPKKEFLKISNITFNNDNFKNTLEKYNYGITI